MLATVVVVAVVTPSSPSSPRRGPPRSPALSPQAPLLKAGGPARPSLYPRLSRPHSPLQAPKRPSHL